MKRTKEQIARSALDVLRNGAEPNALLALADEAHEAGYFQLGSWLMDIACDINELSEVPND